MDEADQRPVTGERAVHVVPLRTYVLVFTALLVLTAATIAVAYFDLGALNTIVALVIAGAKAFLVALFFMHLRYSTRLSRLIAAASLAWFALLVTLVLADVATR